MRRASDCEGMDRLGLKQRLADDMDNYGWRCDNKMVSGKYG